MKEKLYRMGQIIGTPEGDEMIIEGRAIVFNSPTVIYRDGDTEYYEQIARGALDGANTKDCCLKYNHQNGVPILARCRGGSLTLEARDDGEYFRASLFNTSVARDCYELVKADALQCSFAFTVAEEAYDNKAHLRTILRIDQLLDISIVDNPAYQDTFVTARDYFAAQIERERRENLRRRLITLTYT